jgi:hypothetical protein
LTKKIPEITETGLAGNWMFTEFLAHIGT